MFLIGFVHFVRAQDYSDLDWRQKTAKSLTIFQPGDAVRIQIWDLYVEEVNLSRDYPINPDGYIIMPYIGELKVKGLTAYELMQILEERYKEYLRNPYVYVRPLIRITMQGAFNRPGSYRVDPSSSLWDLVALAGGPREDCNIQRMRVERSGRVVMKNLLHSFQKGYSLEDVGIESGDQVHAPFRVRIDLGIILNMVTLAASLVILYLRIEQGRI